MENIAHVVGTMSKGKVFAMIIADGSAIVDAGEVVHFGVVRWLGQPMNMPGAPQRTNLPKNIH